MVFQLLEANMRLSHRLRIALLASSVILGMPAFADDLACADAQCPILADNAVASGELPQFIAKVPLPPSRSQSSAVTRQKTAPRVVVASARVFSTPAAGVIAPSRDTAKVPSFWLTIGTGF